MQADLYNENLKVANFISMWRKKNSTQSRPCIWEHKYQPSGLDKQYRFRSACNSILYDHGCQFNPFLTLSDALHETSFENIVAKGENAHDEQFIPFATMFLT